MLQKFKNFSMVKKIIVGFIAITFLPITLLALSVELAYTGAKTKKFGKCAMGSVLSLILICSFAILGNSESTDSAKDNTLVETANNSSNNSTSKTSTNSTKPESKEDPALTNDELIKKLETYESIYSVIPAAIQEAANGTNKLEMQKTFADSRDILEKGWQDLGDLRNSYDADSNEYKAIENLHLAFFTLRDACKNGIKYLDKSEYKYFEKYENNCSSAAAWLNDYLVYKEKLK